MKKKLIPLIILAIAILTMITIDTMGQTKAVKYHNKLQVERSFLTWESNQPKTRIKAVKIANEQKREKNKRDRVYDRLKRKERRLHSKIK